MTLHSSKNYTILIILALAIVFILAAIFFWQQIDSKGLSRFSVSQNQTNPNYLSKTTENERLTSAPFIITGEISRGNPAKKQIIFTFDAGAGTNSLQKILEVTKARSLKVTFFITGKFAQNYPELIKQIAVDGHEIFNHTYSHPHLTQITDGQINEELDKTEQIIQSLTDKTTKPYFRPPYGDRNTHVLDVASQQGYQSVFWSFDALDWMADKTEQQVKERIYSNLKNGAIILMHVGDNITGNTLNEIFTKIENDGYRIVSLTEGLK